MGVPAPLRSTGGRVRLRGRRRKRAAGGGGAICAKSVHCGGKGSDFFDLRFTEYLGIPLNAIAFRGMVRVGQNKNAAAQEFVFLGKTVYRRLNSK